MIWLLVKRAFGAVPKKKAKESARERKEKKQHAHKAALLINIATHFGFIQSSWYQTRINCWAPVFCTQTHTHLELFAKRCARHAFYKMSEIALLNVGISIDIVRALHMWYFHVNSVVFTSDTFLLTLFLFFFSLSQTPFFSAHQTRVSVHWNQLAFK